MDSVQVRLSHGSRTGENGMKPVKKSGISGSTTKIIAVAAMLIDHIAAVVLTRQIMAKGYMDIVKGSQSQIAVWLAENGSLFYGMQIMRMIGRLGFPIFCFLLTEGFCRTRDVKKYALRLGLFAVISEVPFNLAITGHLMHLGYQNVYFTLLFGLFALCGYAFFDRYEQDEKKELPDILRMFLTVTGVLAPASLVAIFVPLSSGQGGFGAKLAVRVGILCAVTAAVLVGYGCMKGIRRVQTVCADLTVLGAMMILAEYLRTDYGGMGVLTITAMYIFRKKKVVSVLAGCIVLTLMTFSEAPAFLILIPIALYNGRRGLKMKYFFYAFYPVHLLVLYGISVLLGLGEIMLF